MSSMDQNTAPGLPADFDHTAEAAFVKDAVRAIINGSPNVAPFFLADRASYPDGRVRIPDEMMARLPKDFTGEPSTLVTTLQALNENQIVLGPRHRADFRAGAAVMIVVRDLSLLPPRIHGGQEVGTDEGRARDGLSVVVVLATEVIRACIEARDHKTFTKQGGRDEAMRLFPDLPFSAINLFREGQKLLPDWYPGRTSRDVMSATYRRTRDQIAAKPGDVDFDALIAAQVQVVSTAAKVYDRTDKFQKAHHGMSDQNRRNLPMTTFQQQELANALQTYLPLDDLMKAAIMMDVNPATVFSNVGSFATEFAVGMLLGRLVRGFEVTLMPIHLDRLELLLEVASRYDLNPSSSDDEERAAIAVCEVALGYESRSQWCRRFDHVRAMGLKDGIVLRPKSG